MRSPLAIDRVREFWDARPCNIRHSLKPVGSREYFDEVEARKYLVEPHIPGFAAFPRWAGKRVLEIGSGIGTDAINFARHGAHLTVVELSPRSLGICKQRFAAYGLPAEFYLGDAEHLGSFLPAQTYDLIYSFGVLHHTPDPARGLREIARYCDRGTELRVMLYAKWSWKVLEVLLKYGRGAWWRLPELVRTHSEAQTGSPVTYCYTAGEIRRLFTDFKIVEIRKDHIFPYVIEKYARYSYERMWYFRPMPSRLFRWLERALGWHMLIVAKLR